MGRPAIAFVVDGHVVREREVDWDGTALIEKKRRRKYIVLSDPYLMTKKSGLGSKAVNVFFVSTETATSWDAETLAAWRGDLGALQATGARNDKALAKLPPVVNAVPDGATVEPPHGHSVVEDEDPITGVLTPYRVTPEFIFEQSESSDMRAWNQANAANRMMLFLAAGCGAAGMVMLYFVFQLLKGTSWFGGA